MTPNNVYWDNCFNPEGDLYGHMCKDGDTKAVCKIRQEDGLFVLYSTPLHDVIGVEEPSPRLVGMFDTLEAAKNDALYRMKLDDKVNRLPIGLAPKYTTLKRYEGESIESYGERLKQDSQAKQDLKDVERAERYKRYKEEAKAQVQLAYKKEATATGQLRCSYDDDVTEENSWWGKLKGLLWR